MTSVATFHQQPNMCGMVSAATPGGLTFGWVHAGALGATSADGAPEEEPSGGDAGTLEDAARGEREYLRGRVRDELGREPSEEEMDEWLREHTEGY